MSRIRVSVHPLAVFGAFLLFFVMPKEQMFAALSSVLLHEAGHVTAAHLFRREMRAVKLMPVGIHVELMPPRSYGEEFLIAAAGPIMNLLYIIAARLFLPPPLKEATAMLSFSLAVLNLIPVRTLDGGHMARALLCRSFVEETAETVLQVLTAGFLGILYVFALYLLFYTGVNLTLLIFCAYLFSYLFVKKL